jgi:hypothetical protein
MKKTLTSIVLFVALFMVSNLSAQVAVFTDAYAPGVTFAAFDGSTNAVTIDNTVFQSGTSSLKIVVPAAGYTGGALVAATAQNLSTYNAVSFWIKGSAAKTLNVAGIANSAVAATYQTELEKIAVTTTWTKVIVPICMPLKLAAETGLFHFAEGSDEGAYTIWLDNIQVENLASTIVGVPSAAIATETIAKVVGDAFEASGLTCSVPVNGVATVLKPAKANFTFTSATPAVATVDALGVGKAVSPGTSTITAKLGAIAAAGTLTVTVAAVSTPTTAAPTPTRLAADVISLFSNAYTNKAVDTWSASWDQADVADVQIAGNDTKKYTNIVYAGVEHVGPNLVKAKDMTHFHVDIWTPNSTTFKIKLVDFGANGIYQGTPNDDSEHEITFTPELGKWVSYDIPLADFAGLKAKENLAQMILSGSNATIFMDNVYYYKAVVVPTGPTVAAPTPTRPATSVISLFSKPYTNIAGIDWFPNWGQSTVVTDVLIAGDSTKKYSNLNYQGVQLAADLNISTMNFMHIDLWTPNITSLKVSLINTNPAPTVEQAVTLTPTLSGWNSINVPLASFNTINLAKIGQLKFEGVPFGTGTAYLDNIYFFKTGVGTNDVTFAKNLFSITPSVSDASVTINLTDNVKGKTEITVSSLSGQSVYTQVLTTNGAQSHVVSTKNLASGLYIVAVRVGATVQTEKMVITH